MLDQRPLKAVIGKQSAEAKNIMTLYFLMMKAYTKLISQKPTTA